MTLFCYEIRANSGRKFTRSLPRFAAVGACGLALLLPLSDARAQVGTQSVVAASARKELPLKGWGPYAHAHLGPCCLVNQLLGQQFVFPLVISQQREIVVPQRVPAPNGRIQTRLAPAVIQRRALGLSPVQAAGDDRAPTGPLAHLNRRARIVDADGEGLLWTTRVTFAPAASAQPAAPPTLIPAGTRANEDGRRKTAENALLPAGVRENTTSAWGEGEATVECFPAFAEPSGDGLLIRVTLVNASQASQTYGIDLLGGMDTPGPAFALEDLLVQAPPGLPGATVQHDKAQAVFALNGPGGYRTHCYRVSDAYFTSGATSRRDLSGAILPNGLLTGGEAETAADSDNEADQKDAKKAARNKQNKPKKKREQSKDDADASPEAQTALPPLPGQPPGGKNDGEGRWALTRVDSVVVAPGQSVTLFLSVGMGRSVEAARDSAQTLLDVAAPKTGGQTGAYAAMLQARAALRFQSGNPALDRLMAQSLVNVPNVEERRIGIGTRQSLVRRTGAFYDPARDGLMALGWMGYRPTFAAAQLNAWFQTQADPDESSGVPLRNPRAVPPTNLFALWELFQRTHDRPFLKRYYPYARRRYLELLTAGRIKPDAWLFAWPAGAQDSLFIPGFVPPARETVALLMPDKANGANPAAGLAAAPDYAAYVICAARIMLAMAEVTDQPYEVKRQYATEALETTRALNAELWDANRQLYVPRLPPNAPDMAPRVDTLAGLLPLIAGADAQSAEQRAALLHNLTDPNTFWSPVGLRSVSKTSPFYRPDNGANGAVRFGLNWLFWKALLDVGETDTAHALASRLLQGYTKAQTTTGICPEWLDGDTGAAGGVTDYAGDASALLALWAAYHQPGTLSSGWNLNILDSGYDKSKDSLHLILKRLQSTGKVSLLCAMSKPNGKYALTGALTGIQSTDADGVLILPLPADNTTLVVDVVPAQ